MIPLLMTPNIDFRRWHVTVKWKKISVIICPFRRVLWYFRHQIKWIDHFRLSHSSEISFYCHKWPGFFWSTMEISFATDSLIMYTNNYRISLSTPIKYTNWTVAIPRCRTIYKHPSKICYEWNPHPDQLLHERFFETDKRKIYNLIEVWFGYFIKSRSESEQQQQQHKKRQIKRYLNRHRLLWHFIRTRSNSQNLKCVGQ